MEKARGRMGWTLERLDALPDDGNTYELIAGELLVSPPPTTGHESIASVLFHVLTLYAATQHVGRVWTPRGVIRLRGSQTEPDIVVRREIPVPPPARWEDMPLPILVVEILSRGTRRNDEAKKRTHYLDLGIGVATDRLTWHPPGTAEPLVVDVPALFREALGE